jgi:UDP-N-acetylmuramyl pentapeptide phosphotransferase/UDP-N-acetylglucosamine-1-phosphate transferase
MLVNTGAVRSNYRNEQIPVSAGISFAMTLLLVYLLYHLAGHNVPHSQLFLLSILAVSFLGFIDDMLGRRDTTGLKGHFGALIQARLTTGGLKALGGGVIAFYIALFISPDWGNIILNTFLIALTTNFINLLDLRPGRAVKGTLLGLVVLTAVAFKNMNWLLVAPMLGAMLFYFPRDLKGQVMMGDAGSNVLGLALGFWAATGLPLLARIIMLALLVAVHGYTERRSLTETIDKVKILRTIDQLGRN